MQLLHYHLVYRKEIKHSVKEKDISTFEPLNTKKLHSCYGQDHKIDLNNTTSVQFAGFLGSSVLKFSKLENRKQLPTYLTNNQLLEEPPLKDPHHLSLTA